MTKLSEYFKKLKGENKLVQSYLIGNTKYDLIREELDEIFKTYFFNKSENSNIYIQILKNEDLKISKNEIKELLENVSKTSQFNSLKVYIIDECELLNDFSYNAILKTLEEPPKNVYAFLITKNLDAVKSTIISRCQKIFIGNFDENVENEYNDLTLNMIEELEKNDVKFISENYSFYNKINDKNELLLILRIMLKKYNNILNDEINRDNNINIAKICKKILIINDIISMLDYNLNKNLCLDRLIIEFWRCNNETSRN